MTGMDDLPEDYDLRAAMDRAAAHLANAREALDDEHEGNTRRALQGLRAVSSDMAAFAEGW